MTKRLLPLISIVPMTLAACGGDANLPVQNADIIAVLKTRPSLTRFAEALETTGVAGTLTSSGPYTVFAPFDGAVNGPLDEATIRHHILPSRVTFSDMAGESTGYDTLNNDQIDVDVTDQIVVGSALMIESDIQATNGIIHVIDQVQSAAPGPETLLNQQPVDQGIEQEPLDQSAEPIPLVPAATNLQPATPKVIPAAPTAITN